MKRNEPQRPNAISDPATAGGPDTKAGAPIIVAEDKRQAQGLIIAQGYLDSPENYQSFYDSLSWTEPHVLPMTYTGTLITWQDPTPNGTPDSNA